MTWLPATYLWNSEIQLSMKEIALRVVSGARGRRGPALDESGAPGADGSATPARHSDAPEGQKLQPGRGPALPESERREAVAEHVALAEQERVGMKALHLGLHGDPLRCEAGRQTSTRSADSDKSPSRPRAGASCFRADLPKARPGRRGLGRLLDIFGASGRSSLGVSGAQWRS